MQRVYSLFGNNFNHYLTLVELIQLCEFNKILNKNRETPIDFYFICSSYRRYDVSVDKRAVQKFNDYEKK